MGIQVRCPHGHVFKVKDKYAGKRGLCPHCTEQVIVEVPDVTTSHEVNEAYKRAVAEEQRHARKVAAGSQDSIFDDIPSEEPGASTSASLLGSSVIRHNIRCEFCNESVPMWFAKCPSCGHYLDNR